MDSGSLAEWVAALAALASTVLSIAALRLARQANETANRVRDDTIEREEKTNLRERRRDQRENDRDRRVLAGGIQAWWAVDEQETPERWGVLISNDGSSPSLFQDVTLSVEGNRNSNVITIATLPPGKFFVASNGRLNSEGFAWDVPRYVPDIAALTPITKSKKHIVSEISFTDPLGARWTWTAEGGLTEADTSKPL